MFDVVEKFLMSSILSSESKFVRGGLVFGVGFGVSGTCAAPAVVMIGTGHLVGIATVAGLFAGIAARDAWVARASAVVDERKGDPGPSTAVHGEVPTGTVIGM